MIKDREQIKEIERYEQYFSPQDGKHYELNWRALVLSYFTCGPNNFHVECLELVPDSVSINERYHSGSYSRKISLALYNERHPREQLDLRCNCHGFTFGGGNYFINNAQVALLLNDEFTQVPADEALNSGDFDIVCFKEPLAGEWIHSAKHRHGKYMHKKGLHPYSSHGSIREIVSIPDYQDSIPYYFRRNAESCHGICLQPAGELAQSLIETAG